MSACMPILTDVLSSVIALEASSLMASASPLIRDATREFHVIGQRRFAFFKAP